MAPSHCDVTDYFYHYVSDGPSVQKETFNNVIDNFDNVTENYQPFWRYPLQSL